jgi:hypothetical protein
MIKEFQDFFKLQEEERKQAHIFNSQIKQTMERDTIIEILTWFLDHDYVDKNAVIRIRLCRKLTDIDLFCCIAERRYLPQKLREYVDRRIYTPKASNSRRNQTNPWQDSHEDEEDLPF